MIRLLSVSGPGGTPESGAAPGDLNVPPAPNVAGPTVQEDLQPPILQAERAGVIHFSYGSRGVAAVHGPAGDDETILVGSTVDPATSDIAQRSGENLDLRDVFADLVAVSRSGAGKRMVRRGPGVGFNVV